MREKTPKRQAEDFKDLVVAYVKQETVDPIKSSGKQIGFGVGGALVVAIGVLFLAIGTLRLVQTETTWFDGPWTRLIAYVIVIVFLGAGAAISASKARPAPTNQKGKR
jgi:hypothetical protein